MQAETLQKLEDTANFGSHDGDVLVASGWRPVSISSNQSQRRSIRKTKQLYKTTFNSIPDDSIANNDSEGKRARSFSSLANLKQEVEFLKLALNESEELKNPSNSTTGLWL